MKKIDTKHIAFHVLTALYFIWLPLVVVLTGIIIYYTSVVAGNSLSATLLYILFINLIMGALLMFVIRLFRTNPKITKFVRISYYIIFAFALIMGAVQYFF